MGSRYLEEWSRWVRGPRERTIHETGNRLVITDYSNACNTANRTAVLAEVANCVPALTALVVKCSGTRPAAVFIRIDSGETKTIACSSGVQQGGPMGPEIICLAFLPEPELEGEGVKALAYMDDISRSHAGQGQYQWRYCLPPARARRHRPCGQLHQDRGTTIKRTRLGDGGDPLFESVGVRIVEEGGIAVVGVRIGTEEYVQGRATGAVRDGGAGRLAPPCVLPR